MELTVKSAAELHMLLKSKEISATELTKAYLKRINALEDKVRAFVTLTENSAL